MKRHRRHAGQETFSEKFPAVMKHQRCHAGWETICIQFPAAMNHMAPMPPLSFRAERSGVEKSPTEQFPAVMNHIAVTPNRKPFANSFLLL